MKILSNNDKFLGKFDEDVDFSLKGISTVFIYGTKNPRSEYFIPDRKDKRFGFLDKKGLVHNNRKEIVHIVANLTESPQKILMIGLSLVDRNAIKKNLLIGKWGKLNKKFLDGNFPVEKFTISYLFNRQISRAKKIKEEALNV